MRLHLLLGGLLLSGSLAAQPVKLGRHEPRGTDLTDPEQAYGQCLIYRSRKQYDLLFPLARDTAGRGAVKLMALLGELYHRGEGTPLDDAEAARWYGQAAALGHYASMLEVGRLLVRGKGMPHDSKRAETWFRRCVDAAGRAGATIVVQDANQELARLRPVAAAPVSRPRPAPRPTPRPSRTPPTRAPRFSRPFQLGVELCPGDAPWITYKLVDHDENTGVMTFAVRESRRAQGLQGYNVWRVTLRESDRDFRTLRRTGGGRAWCSHCGGQGYIAANVAKQGGFLSVNGRPDIVGWKTDGGTALSVCDHCAGNGLR